MTASCVYFWILHTLWWMRCPCLHHRCTQIKVICFTIATYFLLMKMQSTIWEELICSCHSNIHYCHCTWVSPSVHVWHWSQLLFNGGHFSMVSFFRLHVDTLLPADSFICPCGSNNSVVGTSLGRKPSVNSIGGDSMWLLAFSYLIANY